MGIETMRRWPVYIVFAVCLLLALSLFNSWNLETEQRQRISDLTRQLHECSKQKKSCMDDSVVLLEQKRDLASKHDRADKQKDQLESELKQNKAKLVEAGIQVNRTLVDVDLCKTELQSLKNLQLSKSTMLETLRLEKETWKEDLAKKKNKIEELEKEIERLKELSAKPDQSPVNNNNEQIKSPKVSPKVSPVPQPLKLSPAYVLNKPIEPEFEDNNAKEELEDRDINAINDGNNPDNDPNDADFDQQVR